MLPALILAACAWANPGADRYTGSVADAIDRYTDIAPAARADLKALASRHTYTDVATITRDRIQGGQQYTDLRDMHFGTGRRCATVDRSMWPADREVRALIYCAAGECIAVPSACGNVSRVTVVTRQTEATVVQFEPDPTPPDLPVLAPVEDRSFPSPGDTEPAHAGWTGGGEAGSFGPSWGTVVVAAPCAPAVPEPETWALLLAGAAAVFCAMKGRSDGQR